MYVSFFDAATKKIFFSEELKGKPGGIGLRNYWSKALFEILKVIDSKEYSNWKSKYASQK